MECIAQYIYLMCVFFFFFFFYLFIYLFYFIYLFFILCVCVNVLLLLNSALVCYGRFPASSSFYSQWGEGCVHGSLGKPNLHISSWNCGVVFMTLFTGSLNDPNIHISSW